MENIINNSWLFPIQLNTVKTTAKVDFTVLIYSAFANASVAADNQRVNNQ